MPRINPAVPPDEVNMSDVLPVPPPVAPVVPDPLPKVADPVSVVPPITINIPPVTDTTPVAAGFASVSWATLTTLIGGVIAIGMGYVDAKTGASLGTSVDQLLLGAGFGALLGLNPMVAKK